MMMRKPTEAVAAEEKHRPSAANGFDRTPKVATREYGNAKGLKEVRQSMHPHLSPYFMDLDEFCQSQTCGEESDSHSSGTDRPRQRQTSESNGDPAGIFPSGNTTSHSRLFIPTSLPPMDPSRSRFVAASATPTTSSGHPGEAHSRMLSRPPALFRSSETDLHLPDSNITSSVSSSSHGSPTASIGDTVTHDVTSPANGVMDTMDGNGPTSVESAPGGAKKRTKRKPREYIYNPKPFKQKAIPLPRTSNLKDETYWDKRLKNNVAAKRSRENRRKKEIETVDKCSTLERENAELRERISTLEKQNAWLEGKLTKFLLP